jgi:hypothetical protein
MKRRPEYKLVAENQCNFRFPCQISEWNDPAYKQEVKVIFQIILTAGIPIATQSIKDISKKHTKSISWRGRLIHCFIWDIESGCWCFWTYKLHISNQGKADNRRIRLFGAWKIGEDGTFWEEWGKSRRWKSGGADS